MPIDYTGVKKQDRNLSTKIRKNVQRTLEGYGLWKSFHKAELLTYWG